LETGREKGYPEKRFEQNASVLRDIPFSLPSGFWGCLFFLPSSIFERIPFLSCPVFDGYPLSLPPRVVLLAERIPPAYSQMEFCSEAQNKTFSESEIESLETIPKMCNNSPVS
jgi:hypothetical protein